MKLFAADTLYRAARISPTLDMPHWDQPTQTVAAMEAFGADNAA